MIYYKWHLLFDLSIRNVWSDCNCQLSVDGLIDHLSTIFDYNHMMSWRAIWLTKTWI